MRTLVLLALLASSGCASSTEASPDAGGAPDAGPDDAFVSDASRDGGATDAAPPDANVDAGCVSRPPAEIVYVNRVFETNPNVWMFAVTSGSTPGTFVLGGHQEAPVASYYQGLRGTWTDAPPGLGAITHYGDNQGSMIAELATSAAGEVFAVGWFATPNDIEGESFTVASSTPVGFVARTPAGGTTTVTTIAADLDVELDALAVGADGYVIGGSFQGSLVLGTERCDSGFSFVAAFDDAGTIRWMRCLDGWSADVEGLATDDAGDVYVVGHFGHYVSSDDGMMATSQGDDDGYVMSFSAAGHTRWVRAVGTTDSSSRNEALERVVIAGSRVIAVGYVGPGDPGVTPSTPALGGTDGVVVVLDASTGHDIGLTRVGLDADDAVHDIALDACRGAWVVGESQGATIITRVDTETLAVVDAVLPGEAGGLVPRAVTVSGDRILVTGTYTGSPIGTGLPRVRTYSGAFVLGLR